MILIFVRSLIFNLLFYIVTIALSLAAVPTLLMGAEGTLVVVRWWGRSCLFLLRHVCNIRVEFRGVEKIPEGPLLVASKHQSLWETFTLVLFVKRPIIILKRQLTYIPVFGQLLINAGSIGIDRKDGVRALLDMTRQASEGVQSGGQLLIFPEGTRTAPGAAPDYKGGFIQLYKACKVTCLPVGLNSGLFWPRRSFLRYPGTVILEFMDPLPPGLHKDEFLSRARSAIEDATARAIEAGRREQEQLMGRCPVLERDAGASAGLKP
ncbi:MAG: 1-acyl-sn-glycerol-3-phosphate acyltransferase [Alphaproteobacteria bacterium]|nr:1-acyl-sn-glycerol-3-phosphate acyltransferase [Alphaproteobacteria bacterium]